MTAIFLTFKLTLQFLLIALIIRVAGTFVIAFRTIGLDRVANAIFKWVRDPCLQKFRALNEQLEEMFPTMGMDDDE